MQQASGEERRAYVRDDLQREILYTVGCNDTATLRGITVNVCEGGLCFYIFHALNEGQLISIKRGPGDFRKRGTVRWIQQMGNTIYEVGLQFI